MKNYDFCKDINEYYFNTYASLALAIPRFFDEGSDEDAAVQDIRKLTEQKRFDEAVALAEDRIQNSPEHMQHAFLAMQIFALWGQGKLPHEELLNYFTGLEDVLPNDGTINFDKAVLLVRMKRFNDAMKELEKSRTKYSSHIPSIVLQFWIFYFSGDAKWKPLWKIIKDHQLLTDSIIKIVEIVESINNRDEGSFYDFADTQDLKKANDLVFDTFPPLEIPVAPVQENTLFVAADGGYLKDHITKLIMSAVEIGERNFGIHVHIYNPMGIDLELIDSYIARYPELDISYSYEKSSFRIRSGVPAYFASMRFCRTYQILKKFSNVKKIMITDADVILRKNPFEIKKIKDHDTVFTLSYDIAANWDKFIGGFNVFSNTQNSLEVLAYLTNIILKNFSALKEFWFIDQVALFDTHSQHGKKISLVTMDEIFGEGMKNTPEALLWTYTNEDKLKDNPMNRERARLEQAYGIAADYNDLIKAKYGIVVANRNDEYIAQALRSSGSWCDHEIQYLHRLLEAGDTVLEIGSNMGSHTLPLAKIVGNRGRVIGIEPQRLMFQTICASLAINSMRNAYIYNVACGAEKGTLMVSELDPTEKQNFGGYQPKAQRGDMPVDVITVDSLKLETCKLIKMDIEGMEIDALKGAKETLKNLQPILFFESHGEALIEIINFLKDFGYRVYESVSHYDPMYFATTDKHLALVNELGIRQMDNA